MVKLVMAYYNKIGLLILNNASTKFLVCQKYAKNVTADFIMPGGQFTEATVEECLKNEIGEELGCEIDLKTLKYIGEYHDVASGRPGRDVLIQLYAAKLIGKPVPSTEVEYIHWIGKTDRNNPNLSPIIKNQIIPDLTIRNILK